MGTAIVGVAAYLNPGNLSGLASASRAVGQAMAVLAAVLALVLGVPYVARWFRHRDAALGDLRAPVAGALYGTFPGGILVLGATAATVGPSLMPASTARTLSACQRITFTFDSQAAMLMVWRYPWTRESLAAKFAALFPHLDERQRRLVMGAEARALGHRGIKVVARAADVSAVTVSRGWPSWRAAGSRWAGRAVPAAAASRWPRPTRGWSRRCWRWWTRSRGGIRSRRCGGRPIDPHLAEELTAAGHEVCPRRRWPRC